MSRHPRDLSDTASPHDSGMDMRDIARAEALAVSAQSRNECVNSGPICKVWEAIDEMRGIVNSIQMKFAESDGARKQQARNMTIIVSVASALSTAASVVGLLWKVLHG